MSGPLNLKVNSVSDIALASNLAAYAVKYLRLSRAFIVYPRHYKNLMAIKNKNTVSKEVLKKEVLELSKAAYQQRVKKGHKYQFNYVVSQIILSVYQVYLNGESFYDKTEFKNYLSYPVDKATIPSFISVDVVALLEQGKLTNWKKLDKAIEMANNQNYLAMEYL